MADKDKFADEILSAEELDNVAGGTCHEAADDSRFLNILNNSTDRYGATRIYFTPGSSIEEEIENGWAKVGIQAKIAGGDNLSNAYYLNGQEITQEQARQHAMKVTGHHMTESDWNW